MQTRRILPLLACLAYASLGCGQYTNSLSFSHADGVYDGPFVLSVAGLTVDTVHYTLDGSVPTPSSGVLPGSLPIASPTDAPDVYALIPTTPPDEGQAFFKAWTPPRAPLHKARIVRVASYRDGQQTSPVYTRTFFTDGALAERYTVPVVSLVTDPGSLFDRDTGIHVPGVHYTPASPNYSGNAFQRGRAWERRAHLSYFPVGATRAAVGQDVGVRIHGGSARGAAQKSLRLYARSDYGTRALEYPFFPESAIGEFKRLVLRTTMSDFEGAAMIKDAVAHALIADLDLESQRTQPVVVYLNGEYWGVYTLTERIDERYVGYRAGVDAGDVEIVDVKEADAWPLVDFVESHDLRDPAHYAAFAERVDLDNLVTYMCVEQYLGNYDWPVNNHKYWRERGGKWRAIAYDFDWAFKDAGHDMFEHMMVAPGYEGWPADGFSTALFRNLVPNADFRERYAARFEELLDTVFHPDTALAVLARVRADYRPEVAAHASRWDYPESVAAWKALVDDQVRDFLLRRPAIARQQLSDFFDRVSPVRELSEARDARRYLSATVSDGALTLYNPTNAPLHWERFALTDVAGRSVATWRDLRVAPGETLTVVANGLPPGAYAASLSGARVQASAWVTVLR